MFEKSKEYQNLNVSNLLMEVSSLLGLVVLVVGYLKGTWFL